MSKVRKDFKVLNPPKIGGFSYYKSIRSATHYSLPLLSAVSTYTPPV